MRLASEVDCKRDEGQIKITYKKCTYAYEFISTNYDVSINVNICKRGLEKFKADKCLMANMFDGCILLSVTEVFRGIEENYTGFLFKENFVISQSGNLCSTQRVPKKNPT